MGFDAWIDIREGADRARNLAGRDLLARRDEALAVARELGVMPGELQPLAGIGLDLELDPEIILRLPDRRHLRPAVARDHGAAPPLCAAISCPESITSIFAISTSS